MNTLLTGATTPISAPAVVSVHSWVSFGHVGHGVASFVLQRQGIRVTNLPSVLYSSSLFYTEVTGRPVEAELVKELVQGVVRQPEFLANQAFLTGFLGTPETLEVTRDLLCELRERRKERKESVLYVCDPVLGDRDALYLPESMIACYQDLLLPEADVVTPNRFEVAWLLGEAPPRNCEEAVNLAEQLLNRYPKLQVVMVTGVEDPIDPGKLFIVCQRRNCPTDLYSVTHYRDRHFDGAGDLVSSLVTGGLVFGLELGKAMERAIAVAAALIGATYESGRYELRLIECQDVLELSYDYREHLCGGFAAEMFRVGSVDGGESP